MTRRLLLAYLSITAFALVLVVVPLGLTFSSRESDRLIFDLERDAQAVASLVEEDLENDAPPNLDTVIGDYQLPGGRILVVDQEGRSVADSTTADLGRDYATRPEIKRALSGARINGRRLSNTLGLTLFYVAVPVASQGVVHGAVRITLPSSRVDERVRDSWYRLGALSAVVLATVGAVGLVLARGVTKPVRRVEHAARRLAAGDLTARAGEVGGAPELTDLARQFDATAARLEQLVDAQRQFVADASHQLRTPLTALRLRLETLTPDAADEPRVAAAIAETDRLGRLVDSLLSVARSDSGQAALADVDLVQVAHDRRETWAVVAQRNRLSITVEGPDRLAVRAVEGGVEQMLDNLLSNACAVAPPDSTVLITLTPEAEAGAGGGGRLTVTDAGPGMSADERAQAAARFWRPDGATGSGSGLGLAIVDQLARSGGGRMWIDAGPAGVGLAVTVEFPPPSVAHSPHS